MLIARASRLESTCGSILKALDIMDTAVVDAAEVVGAVKGSQGYGKEGWVVVVA